MMPSLLDRLIDPESMGVGGRTGYGMKQMTDAVRDDLEELLNTRQSHLGLRPEYVEVNNSIVAYGLPDLVAYDPSKPQQREEVSKIVEDMIARFEPRLKNVRVTVVDPGNQRDRRARFHIDAQLNADPAPEVGFETVLELTTGQASIATRTSHE
jgi:type VI secretion system protein ImpF